MSGEGSAEDWKSEWNLTGFMLAQLDELLKRADFILLNLRDEEWVAHNPEALLTLCDIAKICIRKVKPLLGDSPKSEELKKRIDAKMKDLVELSKVNVQEIKHGGSVREDLLEDFDFAFDTVYTLLQSKNLLWRSYTDYSAMENLKNAINKGK